MSTLLSLREGDPKFAWVYDPNRRKYSKPVAPHIWGDIIERGYWGKHKIIGHTPKSWVLEHSERRIPKRGYDPLSVALSQEALDAAVWVALHRHELAELVRRTYDYLTLAKVHSALGRPQLKEEIQ